jgi:hypothetical protein
MCFHNPHQAGSLVHGEVHFALEGGDHIERRPVVKMDHSGIDIRREDANPAREASQVSSCRSTLVVLWGRLRMYLSIGPRFRSEMHCRNCGDGNIPPLVLNNYVGHWTTMLTTEQLCWPPDIYCGHWIDGQILADGGTLGKRKPWDAGKFGWSRFDQDVIGVRRWRVRCGLPTNHPEHEPMAPR